MANNTLSDLRALIRLNLASTSDWPNATLDAWIADAIRFYSAEFPRRWRYTLSLTTGTQAYDLPGEHGLRQVVAVEYPAGEDPQSFLSPADEQSSGFQAGGDYYAIRGISDTTAIESDDAAGQIVFAETVATGESAIISYEGLHAIPTAGDDDAIITVPPQHWEAPIAFVDFRAHAELEADHAVNVSTISIVLSQLGQETRLKWAIFKDVMSRLSWLEQGRQSAVVSWSEIGL